jgi:hypothetical protein
MLNDWLQPLTYAVNTVRSASLADILVGVGAVAILIGVDELNRRVFGYPLRCLVRQEGRNEFPLQ